MQALPKTESEIDPGWLSEALRERGVLERGRVARVQSERIAQGVGLMTRLARLHVTYDGADERAPRTLIAKLPSDQPQNLQIATAFRFYQRECDFYTRVAGETPLRVPRAYYCDYRAESGEFLLLLEDLGAARIGDQVVGNAAEDARVAVLEVAKHHARFWGATTGYDFLIDGHAPDQCALVEHVYRSSIPPALDGFADHFTPKTRALVEQLASATTPILNENLSRTLTICHGDFRADNLFYDGGGVAVVDWQIMCRGAAVFDVAYHLTQSVTIETRRALERPLLREYHRALEQNGVSGYSFERCWEDYRQNALFALIYPINVCGSLDLGNERGRALAEVFLDRALTAVEDLNASDTIPPLA